MKYMTALVQLPLVRDGTAERIRGPEDTARVCEDIRELAQETFHVMSLDCKNHLIDRHIVSLGVADVSIVHPREVFRQAISAGASAVLLSHNHPSGDPAPSAEDLRITRQLIAAGKVIDIKVLDHVIIGRCVNRLASNSSAPNVKTHMSMREAGLCDFA